MWWPQSFIPTRKGRAFNPMASTEWCIAMTFGTNSRRPGTSSLMGHFHSWMATGLRAPEAMLCRGSPSFGWPPLGSSYTDYVILRITTDIRITIRITITVTDCNPVWIKTGRAQRYSTKQEDQWWRWYKDFHRRKFHYPIMKPCHSE